MKDSIPLIAAVFSFLGVVIGALLQYWFTRHLDRQKHHRELRALAYTDYLKCVSEHANLKKPRESADGRDLGFRTADAKCRICLYGAPVVVRAFATFERLGATMNSDEQRAAFTQMVLEMRNDSAPNGNVESVELETVLLGYTAQKS
ncbi:hypothetical protein [Burkholderia plantarii]|uniref:hypothetical protein n=1 Tax=Burkholderia plantarii TaxID=41899 RepID=UPI0007065892|nr:hypothetical protein [Burkholderia plantarii]ALK31829.1 hypothetical protein bpln_1g30650 [Burkholderia plantarii]GLZ21960.1 hypothetical protein Bpla01_54890 [Burkholderia plantarii]